MKRFSKISALIAICVLTISVSLTACGNPKDKPYVKSTGKAEWTGHSVFQTITIVNPTDKIFVVTITEKRNWTLSSTQGKLTIKTSKSGESNTEIEIAPRETKEYTFGHTFPDGATKMGYKLSMTNTQEKQETLQ